MRRATRRAVALAGLCVALALPACEPGGDSAEPIEGPSERDEETAAEGGPTEGGQNRADTYRVYFLRSEEVVPVQRPASPAGVGVEEALADLLRGPSPEEREEGLRSPFGSAGPTVLDSVRVTEAGRVVVDFGDLPAAYPSGSASAAGEALLEALNRTVFQFPRVREAEYRVLGSCDTFWNWIQRDCAVVERGDGTSGADGP